MSGAGVQLDFYTAPAAHAPASIEGSTDSVLSAAACLVELRGHVDKWDGVSFFRTQLASSGPPQLPTLYFSRCGGGGADDNKKFVVACFSAHPLVPALRELTPAPVMSILEASLLMASSLGSRVGILTTSPRWEPLLEQGIAGMGLEKKNLAGVVSSGLSVLDLEELPRSSVIKVLCTAAADVLQDGRGADVIVLGCAGMAGLEAAIAEACQPGMVVLDPVQCGVQMCLALMRMGARTSKIGIYASVRGR